MHWIAGKEKRKLKMNKDGFNNITVIQVAQVKKKIIAGISYPKLYYRDIIKSIYASDWFGLICGFYL